MASSRPYRTVLPFLIACLAFGWAFFHLYLSANIAHNAADQAQERLETDLPAIEDDLRGDGQSALSARKLLGSDNWKRAVARWRQTADTDDRLCLVDREGRLLAAANKTGDRLFGDKTNQPLALKHATAPWGYFNGPIHASLDDSASSGEQVAVAQPLPSRDGYVLLAAASSDKINRAELSNGLWAAELIAFLWTVGLTAVTLHLLLHGSKRQPAADQPKVDVEALKQAQALVRAQETVIFGLAKLSDSRDPETGMHLERIAQFSSMLASGLRRRPDFRDRITPGFIQLIGISSALHDIGKVGVEDSILRKPGSLTADERSRMQRHAEIGADCLKEIERRLGPTNFLQMAREIVSSHHEWWNGQGYPHGLAGEQIPLSARIVAVADVYDALRSKRVYKEALPHEECVRVIAGAAGTQFDPRVVEVFLQIEDRIAELSNQFKAQEKRDALLDEPADNRERQAGEEHVSID